MAQIVAEDHQRSYLYSPFVSVVVLCVAERRATIGRSVQAINQLTSTSWPGSEPDRSRWHPGLGVSLRSEVVLAGEGWRRLLARFDAALAGSGRVVPDAFRMLKPGIRW